MSYPSPGRTGPAPPGASASPLLSPPAAPAPDGIPARVAVVEEIGADAFVFTTAQINGDETKLVARASAKGAPEREAQVTLRPVAADAHLFDPADGTRL